MYMKKEEKEEIIKWYIAEHLVLAEEFKGVDISSVHDLKELENIVRKSRDMFMQTGSCFSCHYRDRDFCPKCADCKEWHWDKSRKEEKDNYVFPYGHWRKFKLQSDEFESQKEKHKIG